LKMQLHAQPMAADSALELVAMTASDLDRVMGIEASAYSFPWTRGNFIDALAAGYLMRMLVQSSDGTLVGYYAAMPGVDELHLLNLTVAPAFQRRGHARTLLAALQSQARALGLSSLWLEVRVSNERALELYRRWGFVQSGLRRDYYPAASGRREDAVVMMLRVPGTAETGGDDGLA
jgi:[ribosomal protein S18]-alanine N-acetyltransferase